MISRTHIRHKNMLYGKPFREKTQLEGEAALLSFSVWKIMLQVQRSNVCSPWATRVHRSSLCALPHISPRYLCSVMEQMLSKEWNGSSSWWLGYNTAR